MSIIVNIVDGAYPVVNMGESEMGLFEIDKKINWKKLIRKMLSCTDVSMTEPYAESYAALLVLAFNFEKENTCAFESAFNTLKKETELSENYKYFVKNLYHQNQLKIDIGQNLYDAINNSSELKNEFTLEGNLLVSIKDRSMHGVDNTNKWKSLI